MTGLRIDRKPRMRKSKLLMFRYVRILLGIVLLSTAATVACSQGTPDFSGQWKQDNDRCQPKRTGDVRLGIEQHEPELTVETSISRSGVSSRHAVQRYTTDGKLSSTTGADGDEFATSVVWKDSRLVFSIEEHEDGRILQSKETWSIIEDGATLERIRERRNGEKQMLYFRRMPSSNSSSKSGFVKAGDK
jgi:hypothetical protein